MTAPDVRPAREDDLPAVMTVLDAGLLDLDAGPVRERIDADDALVAVEGGRILGVAVLEPRESGARLAGIAVRPRRRGSGVGSALVAAATDRYTPITAEFDPGVREFYESLGFEIESRDGRLRGRLQG